MIKKYSKQINEQYSIVVRIVVNNVETQTQSIPNYKQLIRKQIEHSYLHSYIDQPAIEEDKLKLLHILLADQENMENSIVSVMLVQIALDTHDTIVKEMEQAPLQRKQQQLTVLAGDFYSGLYYKRLAEVENIALTGALANGISDITEQKMNLFYNPVESSSRFADKYSEIDFVLIKHIAQYLNWKDDEDLVYMKNWLFLRKLEKEHALHKQGKQTFFSQLFNSKIKDLNFEDFIRAEMNKRTKTLLSSKSIWKQYLPIEK